MTDVVYSSAVEGWSKATPEVAKWTKATVGQHITVGGLGATPVGTAEQVADYMERWVEEADVDGFNLVSYIPERGMDLKPLCRANIVLSYRHTRSSPARSKISLTCLFPSCASAVYSGMTMPCPRERTVRISMRSPGSQVRMQTTLPLSTGGMPVWMLRTRISLRIKCCISNYRIGRAVDWLGKYK